MKIVLCGDEFDIFFVLCLSATYFFPFFFKPGRPNLLLGDAVSFPSTEVQVWFVFSHT